MDDWRTATYSKSGNCIEVTCQNGECKEVATGVRVRDTQDRSGPELKFAPEAWRKFLAGLKN